LNLLTPTRPSPLAAKGTGGTDEVLITSSLAVPDAAPADAVACLHAFAAAWSWSLGVGTLLTQVQTRLHAYRVSLAWRRGTGVSLMAWSDVVPLDEGVGVNELEAACNEARHWSQAAAWPRCPAQGLSENDMPAHLGLFRSQGLTAVMSVPMRNDRGQVVAVLSCERIPFGQGQEGQEAGVRPAYVFVEEDRIWLQQLAALIGPVVAMRRVLSQPWYLHSWSWMEALGQRLSDPRERWLRWSVLAFFGVAAFMAGWPLPYTLAVPARLEPQVLTAVVAPADAVVLSSQVKVGDMVQAGQSMGRLSPEPSLRQRDALAEQLLRADGALQAALLVGDVQAAGRRREVRVDLQQRLDALKDVEALSTVRAPFDGVLIRQAEGGAAGSRVQRGDALWVVSPGLDWRVVLEVGEGDVASLKPGQHATLRLASETGRSVQLLLKRPVPAAVADEASPHFDVDAQAAGGGLAGLRPGMRGMAHIDMPPRPLLWRVFDRLRAWWWLAVWGLW
jgi:hypothetical protein